MEVSTKDVDLVKQSLQRCLKNSTFLDRFYELFLASSPEVKEKLKNTSLQRQTIMLKGSLHIMLLYAAGNLSDGGSLKQLAEVHDHNHRDIKPALYTLWLDSMVGAVKDSDPDFSAELETAWRHTMQPGIDYMASFY